MRPRLGWAERKNDRPVFMVRDSALNCPFHVDDVFDSPALLHRGEHLPLNNMEEDHVCEVSHASWRTT